MDHDKVRLVLALGNILISATTLTIVVVGVKRVERRVREAEENYTSAKSGLKKTLRKIDEML